MLSSRAAYASVPLSSSLDSALVRAVRSANGTDLPAEVANVSWSAVQGDGAAGGMAGDMARVADIRAEDLVAISAQEVDAR